jgi:hypothetical protein
MRPFLELDSLMPSPPAPHVPDTPAGRAWLHLHLLLTA